MGEESEFGLAPDSVLYTDKLPGRPTQFSGAMEELGIKMIFTLSPQAKCRVERTAGTFQDRLVTELQLADAGGIGEANSVPGQFLPRFNQRYGVPPRCPEPAIPASQPGAVPGTDPVLQAPSLGSDDVAGGAVAPADRSKRK